MEVTVEHLGSVQFEVMARHHVVLSDQPLENGGFDEGMTPPELMLASLGSCAAYYAAEYLQRSGITSAGTRVRVTAGKAKNPARLDNFVIDVDVATELSAEHTAGIERAVHRCLSHNTLMKPPTISLKVNTCVPSLH